MLIKDLIYAKLYKKGKSVNTLDYINSDSRGDVVIDLNKEKKGD